MNLRFIGHLLSVVVLVLAVGMLVSAGVALAYGEDDALVLGATAVVSFAVAIPVYLATQLRGTTMIGYREGYLVVSLSWLIAMALGAVPFVLYGMLPPVGALFESMSGFTTTGASVLVDFDQPHGLMFWRSLTHWYGGMGIIVLFLAILPSLGGGSMRLFAAESPGPVSERLTPRIRDTARALWFIYVGISAAEVVALLVAGMSLFDAVTHTFATMGTGGFSPRAASVAYYDSWPIEAVLTVFMLIAGANFALYFAALRGDWRRLYRDVEIRAYLAIITLSTGAIVVSLMLAKSHFGLTHALRESLFQVVSLQTTTGFVSADFDVWNSFARTMLVVLMFVGGCAGSTAGGMKVIRLVLLAKNAQTELKRQLHPQAVVPVKVAGRVIPERVMRKVLGFFFLYMTVYTIGTLLLATSNVSIVTAASAVAATLNNVGPGLEVVGPTLNFSPIHDFGLAVLIAMMFLGRLELFTALVLLTRGFWRR